MPINSITSEIRHSFKGKTATGYVVESCIVEPLPEGIEVDEKAVSVAIDALIEKVEADQLAAKEAEQNRPIPTKLERFGYAKQAQESAVASFVSAEELKEFETYLGQQKTGVK